MLLTKWYFPVLVIFWYTNVVPDLGTPTIKTKGASSANDFLAKNILSNMNRMGIKDLTNLLFQIIVVI
jgi:hypothetical protein